jgi:LPXTG-site transpeptidase (sortase) family protein
MRSTRKHVFSKKQKRVISHKKSLKVTQTITERVIFFWRICIALIQKPILYIKIPLKRKNSQQMLFHQKRKFPIKWFLSIILIAIGVLLIGFPYINAALPSVIFTNTPTIQHSNNPISSFGTISIDPTLLSNTNPSEIPLRIVIPSVNIDLPITEANVINGSWELSETKASHGIGSSYPGQKGNTVIFAHARDGLFLPLRKSKVNDIVYVLTNNTWHRYEIVKLHEVTPDTIEVIQPTIDETLTLFTCSGFADSKRLIVIARPLFP